MAVYISLLGAVEDTRLFQGAVKKRDGTAHDDRKGEKTVAHYNIQYIYFVLETFWA
jgi:hypothetical protein